MHRQSLGSPSRNPSGGEFTGGAPDPPKAEKPIRPIISSRSTRAVHLIPVATILCLLVLFLLSHDPALDLAKNDGGARAEANLLKRDIGRYFGRQTVSAARGLMEERRMRHRKELPAHVRSRF